MDYTMQIIALLILLLIIIIIYCCRKLRGWMSLNRAARKLDGPTVGKRYVLTELSGKGEFISAAIWTKGTDEVGKSIVKLVIDSNTVVCFPFAKGPLTGLNQNNPFGIASFQKDDVRTITIGFSSPLYFKHHLKLSVYVQEMNIEKVISEVIYTGSAVARTDMEIFDGDSEALSDPGGELP